jgi:CRP-like cAMP-binding protein
MSNSMEINSGFIKFERDIESKSKFSCPNKNCFINMFCSLDWKNLLYKKRQILHFRKNNYIFREGELVHGINFIFEGKVKILKSEVGGNELIVHLAKEGELLEPGSIELKNYFYSAISIENSSICFVEKEAFLLALKNNINLTYNMLLYYLKELHKLEQNLRIITNNNSSVRIAEILLYLNNIFCNDYEYIDLNTSFSRIDIANMSGTSYETVIRTLKQFEKSKLISVENNKITLLNLSGLKELNKFTVI